MIRKLIVLLRWMSIRIWNEQSDFKNWDYVERIQKEGHENFGKGIGRSVCDQYWVMGIKYMFNSVKN